MSTALTTAQLDRAAGVLLGMACGDALGAGYEFGPPLAGDVAVSMCGGGTFGWEPGEWTDDTSMAIAIAEVTACGADLLRLPAQDQVAARWSEWVRDAKNVGIQTGLVLSGARARADGRGADAPSAADLAEVARAHDARTGRSGGNGSLMRTAPVALAFLEDPDGLFRAAGRLSALTHPDPEAGEACALWCLAIRHAVLHGDVDGLRAGLDHLPADRAAVWSQRLDDAEASRPADFAHNGWVVQALQGAWSAISTTRPARATAYRAAAVPAAETAYRGAAVPAEAAQGGARRYAGAGHFRAGIEAAVRGGRDTDTVAAIAGALLGATYGASAVPAEWRRILHGWPGLRGRDLVALGLLTARGGHPDGAGTVAAVYGARLTGRPPLECLDEVLAVLPHADPTTACAPPCGG